MKPRIVVTASAQNAAEEYLDALRESGVEPIRLDAASATDDPLTQAEGLLVTGGVDVDPARYGAAPSPTVTEVDRERDAFEVQLLQVARERKLPTFCICRGLQVANVAFGGSLIVDIPTALAERALPHQVRTPEGKTERGLIDRHIVRIEPDSALAKIVGTTSLATGSRHHQAADRIAADLRVTARSDDGIVEALEARFVSPFWLAVQWHPESTRTLDDGASRALFRAFAAAANDYADKPSAASAS